jgi:hypothetical protein
MLTVPLIEIAAAFRRAHRSSSVTPLAKRMDPVRGYFRGSLVLLLQELPRLPVWPSLAKLRVTGQVFVAFVVPQFGRFVSTSVQSPLTLTGLNPGGAVALSAPPQATAKSSISAVERGDIR